ncbi:methyltransferase family protein [Litoribrevibacter albus]|uniref:Membrane protein n=1 Tax=Litoribrevibacter albus TaxID=1473156 RepID=A0AA37W6E6_9GAMM|nr:isoprenylcysteine carboxylmethyltransferase family protein [Litoribrevibacter albus]GLQ31887.1 membrane protein [Litoribrevibacter albus]
MDLKIPPLALLVIAILGQVELSDFLPLYSLGLVPLWIPILWVSIGVLLALSGVVEFRKKSTTVNPMKPDEASSLVTSGIFKYTRNPMYLGMTLVLIGGTFYFSELSTLIAGVFFVLYINQFQIKPEELIMQEKYGDSFKEYRAKVRRWL